MTSSVDRLKELLFDTEAQRLAEVQRRIDSISTTEAQHHEQVTRAHDVLQNRIAQVFDRAGTDDRLLKSVAQIIDGALREAEVSKHEPLSRAMSPVVVKLIKTELKGAQKELVAAIYPMTGTIVKQYVQAAIADLTADINRRLGGKAPSELEARARSLGITVAELAFAEAQELKVDELFLVKRGSGDLLSHWERPVEGGVATSDTGSNRDVLIAGYLSGITAFSEEAFDEQKSTLRAIEMDGQRIFVRASPTFLLAARCSGRAPQSVERIIDDEFIKVLSAFQDTTAQAAPLDTALSAVAQSLGSRFDAERQRIDSEARAVAKPARFTRIHAMAVAVILPALALFAWQSWRHWQAQRVTDEARALLAADPVFRGYPVSFEARAAGAQLRVAGLMPSEEARQRFKTALGRALPQTAIEDVSGVLQIARPTVPEPTHRDRLESFARDYAVFFSNGTELLDEPAAFAAIEQLAGLLRGNRSFVRLIGFTDDVGNPAVNAQLAQARADRVAELLAAAGIGRDRFVAIGRPTGRDVTRATGAGNANRRVSFELGYLGEAP